MNRGFSFYPKYRPWFIDKPTLNFMDTNFIIRNIYEAIPKKQNIAKTAMPSNPTDYYYKIIDYLSGGKDDSSLYIDYPYVQDRVNLENYWKGVRDYSKYPDVVIITIRDSARQREGSDSNIYSGSSGQVDNKLLNVELGYGIKYELDSVLVRNTSARHFCCVLTCGGKEYGFDGESFHRMSLFDWKNLINKDKDWTFKGSSLTWNFRNGYQQLYYYRV